jgi:hypothetical protein
VQTTAGGRGACGVEGVEALMAESKDYNRRPGLAKAR